MRRCEVCGTQMIQKVRYKPRGLQGGFVKIEFWVCPKCGKQIGG
jgi:uncharacterized protein with PIN domain